MRKGTEEIVDERKGKIKKDVVKREWQCRTDMAPGADSEGVRGVSFSWEMLDEFREHTYPKYSLPLSFTLTSRQQVHFSVTLYVTSTSPFLCYIIRHVNKSISLPLIVCKIAG